MTESQNQNPGRGCLTALTSTAGVITTVVTLLTAVIGFLTALNQGWLNSNDSGSPPSPESSLESVVPKQVGDYGRVEFRTVPEGILDDLGATEGVQAKYQTSDGSFLVFDLSIYPSPAAAKKRKQEQIQSWEAAGNTGQETFTVQTSQGVKVGTGIQMVSRQGDDQTVWTDGSLLILTWAPSDEYGTYFRQTLYSQHWGGSIV